MFIHTINFARASFNNTNFPHIIRLSLMLPYLNKTSDYDGFFVSLSRAVQVKAAFPMKAFFSESWHNGKGRGKEKERQPDDKPGRIRFGRG